MRTFAVAGGRRDDRNFHSFSERTARALSRRKERARRASKLATAFGLYEFINPKGGFYAEFVAVNAQHVAPVPKRLDLLHAGASAVTGLTALQGIDDHLRVRRGTTILIFGATGAVGTLAVQFAKRHGARVIGTAHGRAAMALLKKLRVDGVVDLNRKDGADQLRALAPDGIEAALALAGGKALEQLLDQMRSGGRIAFPNGVEPAPRKRSKIRIRVLRRNRESETFCTTQPRGRRSASASSDRGGLLSRTSSEGA